MTSSKKPGMIMLFNDALMISRKKLVNVKQKMVMLVYYSTITSVKLVEGTIPITSNSSPIICCPVSMASNPLINFHSETTIEIHGKDKNGATATVAFEIPIKEKAVKWQSDIEQLVNTNVNGERYSSVGK